MQTSWIKSAYSENKIALFLSILFSFLLVSFGIALMFVSGYLISRAAQKPDNILLIYVPIVLTRGFGLGRPVFRYAQRLVSHNWVLKFVSNLRVNLFRFVSRNSKSFLSNFEIGKVYSALSDDIENIQNYFLRVIFPYFSSWLVVFVSTGIIAFFNFVAAALLLVLLLALMIIVPIFSRKFTNKKFQLQKKTQQTLYQKAIDAVIGINDWINSGRRDDLIQLQKNEEATLAKVKNNLQLFGWWRDFAVNVIMILVVLFFIYWSKMQFNGWELYGVDMIAAFSLAAISSIDSFVLMNQGQAEKPFYQQSIRNLDNFLTEEDVDNGDIQVSRRDITQPVSFEVKNISFAFQKNAPILENVSFSFSKKVLAILGQTGVGKSTLLNLMIGDLNPEKGSVLINGIDVNKLQENRSTIFSVLDQKPYLFDMTIADNLRLAKPNATDEELLNVLKKVHLIDLIENISDGIQTPMLEAGNRFSGGQVQRFALARILLQDTPIIFLDEPTIGLDAKTENEVLKEIFAALKGKTIIWVTHHLSNIQFSDEVIVVENKKVSQPISSKEFTKKNKEYRELAKLERVEL